MIFSLPRTAVRRAMHHNYDFLLFCIPGVATPTKLAGKSFGVICCCKSRPSCAWQSHAFNMLWTSLLVMLNNSDILFLWLYSWRILCSACTVNYFRHQPWDAVVPPCKTRNTQNSNTKNKDGAVKVPQQLQW